MALPENIQTNEQLIDAFKLVLPYLNPILPDDTRLVISSPEMILDVAPAKNQSANQKRPRRFRARHSYGADGI